MKLSEIYGKRACSADGTKKGYVIKIYTDGKKITGLTCADERENEFYLPSESVQFTDKKIIFTRTERAKPDSLAISLGRRCYNARGEYVGVLRDITCRGTALLSAKIGNRNCPVESLILGDIIILKQSAAPLKSDVKKDGKVIFKSGEETDKKLLSRAISLGEYVQTNLKTI